MSIYRDRKRAAVVLLVFFVAGLGAGCATPFRSHSNESLLFPSVIRSPSSVRPTVVSEPDDADDLALGDVKNSAALSRTQISIRESPSDAGRTLEWENEVLTYTAAVLKHELEGALDEFHDEGPQTEVEFEFAGQARTLSGAAGGPSDVIVRLTTTLPSGEEVVSFPQRGAFFSEGDMTLMHWSTLPVSVGLGLVVSGLLFPEIPVLAVAFLVSGGALSLASLGAAAIAEQWVIRKSEQRWSAIYREALVTHAEDIRAVLVAQHLDRKDPAIERGVDVDKFMPPAPILPRLPPPGAESSLEFDPATFHPLDRPPQSPDAQLSGDDATEGS